MATEAKSKPNLLLVAAIAGVFLILAGQGIIDVKKPDPNPVPTPVVIPEPSPSPTPTPTPTPVPNPTPTPTPQPEPPIVIENFPSLPQTYNEVSKSITASLFKKETAEDALTYARAFRDAANALRVDTTITSNSHFIKVYENFLRNLVNAYPGLATRNAGLAAAIEQVLQTQGLEIATWDEAKRKSMAEAMDAVSARCLQAYKSLMGYPADVEEFDIIQETTTPNLKAA